MPADTQNLEAIHQLQQEMRRCRLCIVEGFDIFPRAIFSGSPDAKMMIIGQAPGITEKEAGRPFNAGSGTRLFKWLSQAGINEDWFRETQYMTAVTKCYPGHANSGSGDRVPSRTEQRLCRPFLDQEIDLIKPQLIVPVGKLAISLFYPNNTSLYTIIGTSKNLDGTKIIPLPHPSGASRWHQIEKNRSLIQKAIELIQSTVHSINL